MRYQLKLWDSKRERKLTGPNTLPAVHRTKGLSKSREELACCGRPSPAGGRRQGGGERGRLGPKDRIPYRTANRPPVSNQRPPEILDGRHPPGGSWRDTGRRHPTRPARAGMGTRRGEGAPHPGRVRRSSSWLPEPLGRGRHKTQAQLFVPCFSGTPEGWNPASRRARSIWNSREPEQRIGESSASPSPQRDGTSNLNKRPPPPACVRAEIRH